MRYTISSRLKMILLLLFGLCFAFQTVQGQYRDNDEGLRHEGVSVGVGSSYGMFGISYQNASGKNPRAAWHLGVGYFPAGETLLASVGAKIFVIENFYINPQFGMLGTGSSYWEGEGFLFGPSILAGNEFQLSDNLGLAFGIGASHDISKYDAGISLAADLGLIFKL